MKVRVRMRVRVRIRLAVEPRCLDARLEWPGEHLLARGARARLRLRLRRLAPAAPFGRERASGLELLREQRVELRGALLGVGLEGQG